MDESTLWALGSVAGLTVLGASAGAAVVLTGGFTPAAFSATLFGAIFLASGLAVQLYRRGKDYSTLVGGLGGFLSVFAFFATPIAVLLAQGDLPSTSEVWVVLLVPPLVAGAASAGGTLFLASGVRRYRAKNGLIHAPQRVDKP